MFQSDELKVRILRFRNMSPGQDKYDDIHT